MYQVFHWKFQRSKAPKFRRPRVSKLQSWKSFRVSKLQRCKFKVPKFQSFKVSSFTVSKFQVSGIPNFQVENIWIPKCGERASFKPFIFRIPNFPNYYVWNCLGISLKQELIKAYSKSIIMGLWVSRNHTIPAFPQDANINNHSVYKFTSLSHSFTEKCS